MEKKNKMLGFTIATAAAIAFASVTLTGAYAEEASPIVCYGANACKGQGACKTATSSCKGENACKGQGFTMENSEESCLNDGGTTTQNP